MVQKFIINPIMVNENLEIIDGQHRFTASKELGLPIYYIVEQGGRLEDVQVLNTNTKNWTLSDYIDSYCNLGNENYLKIKEFISIFPDLSISSCVDILTDYLNSNYGRKSLRNGSLVIKNYEKSLLFATQIIELKNYIDFYNHCNFIRAMMTIVKIKGYNNNQMYEKIKLYRADFFRCSNISQYRNLLHKAYNKNVKDKNKLLDLR
jgi:uncharacterized protein YutD